MFFFLFMFIFFFCKSSSAKYGRISRNLCYQRLTKCYPVLSGVLFSLIG
ncbi:hypothetical protein BACUNI_02747 [Bacteroides uniformis ATCC 8492]|uniref:Uncharacterized protein n=1 Tax=Bacteroides uniformis (strain ATCC 8492 / DSM 6597 / CCUG 4942 / CIP 103695 / JCM 5828 / KCTC 5204 / NCTC 13054 / VPI 0061) TaxID=411479 RepID=A0ABC9N9Q0_BACUC|nr:hypothetical protein BACUNI_02747 [Bacteroides uniformis ATCC 8492]